jgi:membrane associated rhomboid family serine protease
VLRGQKSSGPTQFSKMIPIRDDAPRFATPYITYFLIALNVAVFLVELVQAPRARQEMLYRWGFTPATITAFVHGDKLLVVESPVGTNALRVNWATALVPIITSMFLHANFLHILSNMWFFWIFGDNIEDYLGHFWFLIFYFLAGIAATGLQYVLSPGSAVPGVGASGAIAGVMGAYLILFPSARVLTLLPLIVFFTFVQIPAWLILGYWFVVQFLSGTATSIAYSSQTGGGIAFWAHVGGFIAGIVLIKFFPRRPRRYHFVSWG